MGPSLIILLIIVVWVIVLAPLVLGNNKPIRRAGEGYEETRVLHEGGTAPVAGRRRPKLTAADVHRYAPDDGEFEVVEAVADDEPVLIDDTEKGLSPIFRRHGGAGGTAAPLFHDIMAWMLDHYNVSPSEKPGPKLMLEANQ